MFPDFSDLIQPHLDRMRPVAHEVADRACAYADHMCDELTRIRHLLEGDPTESYRERPTVTLAAGTSNRDIVVPAGEWWVLETVTLIPTGVVGTPGSVTAGVSPGLPMFGANHPGRPVTAPGSSVRFESGTVVVVTANEVDVMAAFQFRVERKRPTVHGVGGVREQHAEPGITPPNGEVARHTGVWSTH